jgi:hypothetical protein
MAIELGTKVFFRAAVADGSAISIAFVTAWNDGDRANLAVKPDQAAWFDVADVEQRGNEAVDAACWSAWIGDLQPTA